MQYIGKQTSKSHWYITALYLHLQIIYSVILLYEGKKDRPLVMNMNNVNERKKEKKTRNEKNIKYNVFMCELHTLKKIHVIPAYIIKGAKSFCM